MTNFSDWTNAVTDLIQAGQFIDSRHWVPATSGNFSMRLADNTIAITVSGKHKGRLQADDIMRINLDGESLDGKTPSAETLLHTQLYQCFSEVQAVLHTHSLNSVLLSKITTNKIILADYELLKAFAGLNTHETELIIPIFANDQTIPRLAQAVTNYFADNTQPCFAYLIAGHGLYAWGRSMQETLRYLEALDYLFACELFLKGKHA